MHNVRTQFIRICLTLTILILVGAWQRGFVLSAIGANPALNLIIFGTFIFGLTLVFNAIRTLRNEYRAFYALIEQFDDIRNEESAKAADPLWKYFRCASVGVIFERPKILWQSYQLISGQLHHSRHLEISTSTMQTLIDGIDSRLQEVRSLISYVAGILIFLGLIGTFIGLMVTLASVGDILGALDLTSSDPTGTVATLMENLQTPLSGMATGFSSSLFGLVTSLALSLMIQLLVRAGGGLRADFSDWLSNAVELHESGQPAAVQTGAADGAAARMEERRLALLMRSARFAVQAANRQSRSVEELTQNVKALSLETRDTSHAVDQLAHGLRVLAEQNRVIHLALARSSEAFQKLATSTDMRAEIAELTGLMSTQFEVRDARLEKILRQTYRKVAMLSAPATNEKAGEKSPSAADNEEAASLIRELGQHTDELNISQLNRLLAAMYRLDEDQNNKTAASAEPETAPRSRTTL